MTVRRRMRQLLLQDVPDRVGGGEPRSFVGETLRVHDDPRRCQVGTRILSTFPRDLLEAQRVVALEFPPTAWRFRLAGYGRRQKEQRQGMAKERSNAS